MSKLQTIRGALESNPDAVIVKSYDIKSNRVFTNIYGHYAQFVNYFVAPKTEVQDINPGSLSELERFMLGLVPDLEPNQVKKFEARRKGWRSREYVITRLGSVSFVEEVGEVVSELKLTDEELSQWHKSSQKTPPTTDSRDAYRDITINVCPNSNIAMKFIKEYETPYLGL